MNLNPDIEGEVRRLLASKQLIQAIMLVKDATQCGLKEAKEYVDALLDGRPAPVYPSAAPENIDDELSALLAAGRKLDAIKRYNDTFGYGLQESKEYIDALEAGTASTIGGRPTQQSRDTQIDDMLAGEPVSKRGPCFVATACYGDYGAPQVVVLRAYRDDRLMRSATGRAFVMLYYRVSPPLARLLDKSASAQAIVRALLLDPLVRRITRRYR